jgi:hypothetical protein
MIRTTFAAVAAGALVFSIQQSPDDLTRPVTTDPDQTPAMTKALASWIDVDFRQTPLDQAVESLSRQLGASIVLDEASLANAMVGRNQPITLTMRRVRLTSAFDAMLRPLNLEVDLRPDHLLVVDRESTRRTNVVRSYPVADLALDGNGRWVDPNATALIRLIQDMVDRDIWEPNGGDALANFHARTVAVVVNAPPDTHRKVADFLRLLRLTRERTEALLADRRVTTLERALVELDQASDAPLKLEMPAPYPPAENVLDGLDRVASAEMRLQESAVRIESLESRLKSLEGEFSKTVKRP